MTNETYLQLIDEWTAKRHAAGIAKGNEYVPDSSDRLSNFKSIGQMLGLSPERVLLVYMLKHVVSVCTYFNEGRNAPPTEPIEGRLMDIANYVDLLYGLVKDREGV